MLILSPVEQGLYFSTQGAKHGVVVMETFRELGLCTVGTLKVVISRLLKKGALLKIKNGVYVWNLAGSGFGDVFFIGQNAFDGYIAFSSALYLHKLFDEFPFTIFIATRSKSASKFFGQTEVQAVALNGRAVGVQRLGEYWVSTLPKTLYDCFHLPDYGGGIGKILWAVYKAQLTKQQWMEFISYVEKFELNSSKRKIGAFLALLDKTDHPVPRWVLKKLGTSNAKLDQRKLLSWWYA